MLTMKGKTPTAFVWNDGVSETTVTLSPQDDQEALVQKLKRILDLMGENTAVRNFVGTVTEAEAMAEATPSPLGTNGWKPYGGPELPPRLKGEVELMEDGA